MAQKAYQSNAPHSEAETHRLRYGQLGKYLYLVRITSPGKEQPATTWSQLFSFRMLSALRKMDGISPNLL
jgi:hypothetical protein